MQLSVKWNGNQLPDYPRHLLMHQPFEEQAAKRPDKTAIFYEGQYIMYHELDRRANQLANYLRELGVDVESRVGIFIERSIEQAIGIIAIFKAGGVCIPLDPTLPKQRIAFMLRDSRVCILLTQKLLINRLPEYSAQVICIDTDREALSSEDSNSPRIRLRSDSLAFVLYTSGTTGVPKGVMLSHQACCGREYYEQQKHGLTANDRCLLKSSSIRELFWPLWLGAQIIVAKPGGHKDPSYLVELIKKEDISVLGMSPSMLRIFLENERLDGCASIQHVFTGGEALPFAVQKQFFRRFPEVVLHHTYGLTETGIVTWNCMRSKHQPVVHIGQPITGRRIYLLDSDFQLVPNGTVGEIYVGGEDLAQGYLNQPDFTAERFISDRFTDRPDAKMYRTGDLARCLCDGQIEFIGRLDDQITLRGFRIEPKEIETIAMSHPGVRDVAVIGREDNRDDRRLIAYIVPRGKVRGLAANIIDFLKSELPNHMVPSSIVMLDALPLTPIGKVDRKALPAPDALRTDLGESFIEPRDPLERQLARIWEEVLAVKPVGILDNFFELGGHSLLALVLVDQIKRRLRRDLPLQELLEEPTVQHIAGVLRIKDRQVCKMIHATNTTETPLIEVQSAGSRAPFFCVVPLNGFFPSYVRTLLGDLSRNLGSQQPFYALQPPIWRSSGEVSPCTIEDLATFCLEAARKVHPEGDYYLGGWCSGGVVAFEMAQQLQKQGCSVALVALLESFPPVGGQELLDSDMDSVLMGEFFTSGLAFKPINQDSSELFAELRQLNPEDRLEYAVKKAKEVNALPPDLPSHLVLRLFRIFRHATLLSHRLLELYRSTMQIYHGRIIQFSARNNNHGNSKHISGWHHFSSMNILEHIVPGDHVSMLAEPQVQILAQQLKPYLG